MSKALESGVCAESKYLREIVSVMICFILPAHDEESGNRWVFFMETLDVGVISQFI